MGGRSVAGEAHAQGCTEKKVVKPAQQRLMVQYLRSTYGLGIRRACRTLPIARSTLILARFGGHEDKVVLSSSTYGRF
jgi:hypothetical protein